MARDSMDIRLKSAKIRSTVKFHSRLHLGQIAVRFW